MLKIPKQMITITSLHRKVCEWFHSKLFTKSILKLMSSPKDEDEEELIECVKSPTRLD